MISLGAFTLLGAAHADHRVKMLILLDSLERNLATKNSAEHGAGWHEASPAIHLGSVISLKKMNLDDQVAEAESRFLEHP